jgi:hypothetical protein
MRTGGNVSLGNLVGQGQLNNPADKYRRLCDLRTAREFGDKSLGRLRKSKEGQNQDCLRLKIETEFQPRIEHG